MHFSLIEIRGHVATYSLGIHSPRRSPTGSIRQPLDASAESSGVWMRGRLDICRFISQTSRDDTFFRVPLTQKPGVKLVD